MPPRHASTTDIGRRSVQQDDLVAVPIWAGQGHLYGVFDGHGMFSTLSRRDVFVLG